MKMTIEQRKCDCCGQIIGQPTNNIMFGGSPWDGWMELKFTNGSTQLQELQKKKEFDFCSKDCLIKFLNAN